MIRSWKDRRAEAVFYGEIPKGFPPGLAKATRRRLEALNAAARLEDLRLPPGHRLHELKADRAGQWSISVNMQFRICFRWTAEGPADVEFTDYH